MVLLLDALVENDSGLEEAVIGLVAGGILGIELFDAAVAGLDCIVGWFDLAVTGRDCIDD